MENFCWFLSLNIKLDDISSSCSVLRTILVFLSLLAHHSLTHSIFYIFLSDTFSIVCLIQRSDCSYNFIIIEATGACKVKAFCLDWHTHKEYRRNNTLIWGEIWEGERASIKYTQTELRGFSIFPLRTIFLLLHRDVSFADDDYGNRWNCIALCCCLLLIITLLSLRWHLMLSRWERNLHKYFLWF